MDNESATSGGTLNFIRGLPHIAFALRCGPYTLQLVITDFLKKQEYVHLLIIFDYYTNYDLETLSRNAKLLFPVFITPQIKSSISMTLLMVCQLMFPIILTPSKVLYHLYLLPLQVDILHSIFYSPFFI